jgi:nucleoside-diphosphate-sugar epimerase
MQARRQRIALENAALGRHNYFGGSIVRAFFRKTESQRILVTGGAGYIGAQLLPKLLNSGYKVRLLDRLFFTTKPISGVINHPNLELVRSDFRCVEKVAECVRDVDTVVHLGALDGHPACALNEDLTVETNLIATRNIAELAKSSGVKRFVFASSCSVYGANGSDELLSEESELNPVSLYAKTKVAAEQVLMDLTGPYFSPVCLRFPTIYGLSGRMRFDLEVNQLTAKALLEGQIAIQDCDKWRSFLHVEDAVTSILKVLEAPFDKVHKEIFNVGSPEQNCTTQQIGEMIEERIPATEIINLSVGDDHRNYKVNFDKIQRTLDFVPQWNIEQGIEQVICLLKSDEVSNYQAPQHSNLKFFMQEGVARFVRRESNRTSELMLQAASREFPIAQAA